MDNLFSAFLCFEGHSHPLRFAVIRVVLTTSAFDLRLYLPKGFVSRLHGDRWPPASAGMRWWSSFSSPRMIRKIGHTGTSSRIQLRLWCLRSRAGAIVFGLKTLLGTYPSNHRRSHNFRSVLESLISQPTLALKIMMRRDSKSYPRENDDARGFFQGALRNN